jgi:hypothetical protein
MWGNPKKGRKKRSIVGKVVSLTSLKDWMADNLVKALRYCPLFHILVEGWISFQFSYRKDMESILNEDWGWGPFGLVLKEWSISFDHLCDSITPSKIWAILPNLPLVFWNELVFQSI